MAILENSGHFSGHVVHLLINWIYVATIQFLDPENWLLETKIIILCCLCWKIWQFYILLGAILQNGYHFIVFLECFQVVHFLKVANWYRHYMHKIWWNLEKVQFSLLLPTTIKRHACQRSIEIYTFLFKVLPSFVTFKRNQIVQHYIYIHWNVYWKCIPFYW